MKFIKIIFACFFISTAILISSCGVSYTIYFNSNGGSEVASITTDGKSTVSITNNPIKEGYIFDGWYWDNDIWERPFDENSLSDEALKENISVYAKWSLNFIEGLQFFLQAKSNSYFITGYTGAEQSIIVPDTYKGIAVTGINAEAFEGNSNVVEVDIPNSVTSIEKGAFYNCTQLQTVIFEAGSQLEYIGVEAFAGCSSLTSITLPQSVKSIGNEAFAGCTLMISFTVGKNVEYLSFDAFAGCTALEAINVESDNIYYTSNGGVLLNEDSSQLILYPLGKTDATYTLPSSITYIFSNAIAGNLHLSSVNLNQVEVIGEYAFFGCENLVAVSGGSQIQNIQVGTFEDTAWFDGMSGEYAYLGHILMRYAGNDAVLDLRNAPQPFTIIYDHVFMDNKNLQSVIFPDDIKVIGYGAFLGCSNLEDIYLLPLEHTVFIEYSALSTGNVNTKIHIAEHFENLYKQDLVFQMYGYDKMLSFIPITVSFDSKGGENYAPVSLNYGGVITNLPENISKSYHIFDGWYFGDQKYQNGILWDRLETTELTAIWIAKNYKIEYVNRARGSKNDSRNPLYFNFEVDFTLYSPSAIEGYDFAGWYDNPDFVGSPITNLSQLCGDTVLYALFKGCEIKVNFDLGYDTNEELPKQTVSFGSTDYVFVNPDREDYEFIGWYYIHEGEKEFVWDAKIGPYSSWYLQEEVTLIAEWVP